MKPLFRIGLAMLVLTTALSLCPAASAWQNGRSTRGLGGTTVQQWVLAQAVSRAARSGADWVDLRAALQTVGLPDTVVHDYRYHQYARWEGSRRGQAPQRTAVYFALVRDALQAGDVVTASRLLGMLTHYYTDACDPLHTGAVRAERRMHRRFERDVMAQLNARGRFERRLASALAAGAAVAAKDDADATRLNGIAQHVAAFTSSSARRAQRDYRRLVRFYLKRGFGRAASRIAAKTLRRSVRGVADLIEAAARPPAAAPAPPAGSPALLSTGRAASASSEDVLYHAARFANDGDRRSPWVAAVAGYPQRWQVDLGAKRALGSISIDWYKGGVRSYSYDIRVSSDRSTWHLLVDQRRRRTFGSSSDPLAGAHARYVRVTILGYAVGPKAGKDSADRGPAAISESRVYGPAAPLPDPTPTPTPAPDKLLDVTAFGAKGDGATDDKQAILAAFAKAHRGDTVYFPAGTYRFGAPDTWLTVASGVDVRGEGMRSTWLVASLRFNSDSSVSDLKIGQRDAGTPAVSNQPDSTATSFTRVRFRGGGATYAPVILLGGCRGSHKSCSFIRFESCEVERNLGAETDPPSKNLNDITILSSYLAGETVVHDITFDHCRIGVSYGKGGWDIGAPRMAFEVWPDFHNGSGGRLTTSQTGQKPWYNVTVANCVVEATDWSVLDFSDQVTCDNQGRFAHSATGVVVRNNVLNGAGHRWAKGMGCITFEGPVDSVCRNNTIYQGGALGSTIQVRGWETSEVAQSGNVFLTGYGIYAPSPHDP